MSRRPVLAALAASLVLVAGAACGSGSGPTGPASAPPPRVGAVAVDPPAGPVGTTFTLTAGGLKEGEAVAFEITFPGQGKAYPGAALTVPSDGTATTSYRATTANQPGDYLVRLTGPPGSLAEGKFTVTDGPPIAGAVASETSTSDTGPATTARTGTTSRVGRSTTTTIKGGSTTTSTSIKGSTTTPTTRRVTTTTLPTGTTKTTVKP
jgi:hypothetical protein